MSPQPKAAPAFQVKVQTPLYTGEPEPQYLVYDKSREFVAFVPVGSWPELDAAMDGRVKRYFAASLDFTDDEVGIDIDLANPLDGEEW